MIERRRESRALKTLTVSVWGIDANAKAFNDHAVARDISLRGALLDGLEHPLRPGDLVGVRHGERQARFRVVWIGKTTSEAGLRAAVQRLERDECPWRDQLPEVRSDSVRPAEPRPAEPENLPPGLIAGN